MYLRGFAEAMEGMVPWRDLETGRSGRASVGNLGVEKHYYDFGFEGVTISGEQWLTNIEAQAAPWLGLLRKARGEFATGPEGMLSLSRFAAAQFFRSPSFRSQMERYKKNLVTRTKEYARGLLPSELLQLWDSRPDEVWLGQDPSEDATVQDALWMIERTQGYANLLLCCMDWTLLEAPDGAGSTRQTLPWRGVLLISMMESCPGALSRTITISPFPPRER